jgi:hypothetical protein
LVVETEGPIHTEEVARRIREAFALQKTGGRILTHVKNSLFFLLSAGAVAHEDEFWSVPGRTVGFIRNRRRAALPLRRAAMIAPAEYQFAMSAALKEAAALSLDDLIIQTARLFGFDRTGPDLTREIQRQADSLIQGRTIAYDGEKLRAT